MGELIKVVKPDNDLLLCGLTAGHLLDHQIDQLDETLSSGDSSDSRKEGSGSDEAIVSAAVKPHMSSSIREESRSKNSAGGITWVAIGTNSSTSFSKKALDRDWVLIENIEETCRQNFAFRTRLERRYILSAVVSEVKKSVRDTKSSQIVKIRSNDAVKTGIIQVYHQQYYYQTGETLSKFIQCHYKRLLVNLPIGSSGSWVVNNENLQVYGHVIAEDPLGDLLVVPMRDVLNDIKETLGAKSVEIARLDDIETILEFTDLGPPKETCRCCFSTEHVSSECKGESIVDDIVEVLSRVRTPDRSLTKLNLDKLATAWSDEESAYWTGSTGAKNSRYRSEMSQKAQAIRSWRQSTQDWKAS
ncbi:hypothetical protein K469DRAFT_688568 [Zopfia rhizophila CBS 207.26]|uniref:Uncharacterized protein n=1 Tax=Zopfia rhizophila CBS 207.26 TaxID=1314779 RepID=A0A6A6DXY4_9PEZI|nr:hypothetical protein K469DRAFT_688568 [Zopfia rhizophila CBS 207.26]